MWQTILTIRAVPFSGLIYLIFLICFIALAFVAVILKIISGKSDILLKKRLLRLSSFGLAAGITGLVFLFFNYERAMVIGSRIWFLISAAVFLIWLGFIIYDFAVRLPKVKGETQKRKNFEKYLPK